MRGIVAAYVGSRDKCEVCGRGRAGNFYGLVITDRGTFVGTARWGRDGQAAYQRARESVGVYVLPGDFVYSRTAVRTHNRREVVRAYQVDNV